MEKILDHINFLQLNSKSIFEHISNTNENKIIYFCSGITKRLNDIITSSKILFNQIEENKDLEFSIGIIYRAIILDTLICLNWRKDIESGKINKITFEELEANSLKYCNEYLAEGINFAISTMEIVNSNEQNKSKISNFYQLIVSNYPEYFEDYANNDSKPILKFGKAKSAKVLFKQLQQNKDLKNASGIILQSYDFLSKYDHFNIIYFDMMNQDLPNKIKHYEFVLESFVIHLLNINYILSIFLENNEFIKSQDEIITNYFKSILDKKKQLTDTKTDLGNSLNG